MLPTPKRFRLYAGAAEGLTHLTAFDGALLAAGLGNINLVRVSSILPPDAQLDEDMVIPPGSLVPTAYGAITSDKPGETIAAAVAVGLSPSTFGVIMEYSGRCTRQEAEARVRAMVEEAFSLRRLSLEGILVRGVEHQVKENGCAFAGVAMWY